MTQQKIWGFYHVATLNHWEDVVKEHFQHLKDSGLFDATEKIFVQVVGTGRFPKELVTDKVKLLRRGTLEEREKKTLDQLRKHVKKHDGLVWYAHTKGVSHGPSNETTEAWRRYMQNFVIDEWRDCVEALKTADICGVDWHLQPKMHFSGNYWWGKAEYLRTLGEVESNKHGPEFWVGTGVQRPEQVVSFFESNMNLYGEEIKEQAYAEPAVKTANEITTKARKTHDIKIAPMQGPLKVAHVCNYAPGLSGMYGTVRDLMRAERKVGVDAQLIDSVPDNKLYGRDEIKPVGVKWGDSADIICWHHAMLEAWFNEPHRNIVLFLHGTPEFNFATEMYGDDRALSLIIGLANKRIPRAFITMWKRHVPFWEHLLRTPVHLVPAWTDLSLMSVSQHVPDPNVIKIGLIDFWRLTREPFSFFTALHQLQKKYGKKVEVNAWGLVDQPNKTYQACYQWLVEDGVLNLKGNTQDPAKDIYHQNDLILTMSTEETRVVREAYACGVPVVCGRELEQEFSFFSADCVEPGRLAAKINECHEAVCTNTQEWRGKLRGYAEEHFDADKAVGQIVDIFKSVTDKHGSVNRPTLINGRRMVTSVDETAEKLKTKLQDPRSAVAYVRFGDGELLFMSNQIKNGGMHHNSEKLRQELIEAFTFKDAKTGNFLVSSAAGICNEGRMRKGLFASFDCDEHLVDVVEKYRPGETLDNYIALAYKSVFEPEWFMDFLRRCFHGKRVVFVGGELCCMSALLKCAFNIKTCVSLPMVDAYYALDDKWDEIEAAARSHDVMVCAAGMCAKVIAKRLWSHGDRINFVDIGSIADAFAGINDTRSWIKMMSGTEYRSNYEQVFIPKKTDIIVLSHKNEEKTIACFESIAKNTSSYRVIWVDNGSGDESIAKVKPIAAKLADCELMSVKTNVGFSRGVNTALRKVFSEQRADYVVLLNNDVVVTSGWLDDMIAALIANNLDAVGPITSENNPHSVDALRPVLKTLPTFGQHETLEERAEKLRKNYGSQVLLVDNMMSFFCCLMKREAVEQVGLLDENLFAYGEDNDYFERMKRLGRRFGIAAGAYVHHDHHATSKMMGDGWIEQKKDEARKYLREKYEGKR